MEYSFKCPNCQKLESISIPISEYDEKKDKQKCSVCGAKLSRVIEFEGSVGLCSGMYGTGNGGWNA